MFSDDRLISNHKSMSMTTVFDYSFTVGYTVTLSVAIFEQVDFLVKDRNN